MSTQNAKQTKAVPLQVSLAEVGIYNSKPKASPNSVQKINGRDEAIKELTKTKGKVKPSKKK